MIQYGLPDDHLNTYTDRARALSLRQVNDAARSMLRPNNLVWVVVGDKTTIAEGIRELNHGTIFEMDADGNVVQPRRP